MSGTITTILLLYRVYETQAMDAVVLIAEDMGAMSEEVLLYRYTRD